jgi:iron complex outermembrane receptor protein
VGGGSRYRYTLTLDEDGTAVSQYTIPLSPIFLNPGLTPCIVTPWCRPLTVFPQTIVIYREEKEWFSHELTLTSTHDGPLQWLAGVYRYHERYSQPVYTVQPNQPQLATPIRFNGTPAPLNPDRRLFDNRPKLEDTSYAVFGQVDWTFLTGWKATFGLRYSHDHKQGAESVRAICFATAACLGGALVEGLGSLTPAIDVTPAIVAAGTPQGTTGPAVADSFGFFTRGYDASWEALSGVAGVQWEPDSDTMIYGRYSRGYKAGGFRVGIDTVLGAFPYTDNESVDAFEVGLKRNWRRVQANLAAFYYDYKDLQIPLVVANLSGGLAVSESRFLNVSEAQSYGLELEGVWSPIEPLRITASYGYLHTQVRTLSGVIDPNDPTALDARARPLTPFQACTGAGAVATPFNPIPHPLCDINTSAVQRPQDLSGNRLPNSPKHKLALNALYTHDFKGGSLSLSASYVWRDTQYMGLFTRGYYKSPAWDQVDGRLVWRDKRDRYTAILFVRNLFDTLGYEGGAGAGRGAFERTGALPVAAANVAGISSVGLQRTFPLTPPRTYGIELQVRFGQGR